MKISVSALKFRNHWPSWFSQQFDCRFTVFNASAPSWNILLLALLEVTLVRHHISLLSLSLLLYPTTRENNKKITREIHFVPEILCKPEIYFLVLFELMLAKKWIEKSGRFFFLIKIVESLSQLRYSRNIGEMIISVLYLM